MNPLNIMFRPAPLPPLSFASLIFIISVSLPTTTLAKKIETTIVQGQKKSALCAGCHGAYGIGLSEEFPNLAGQKQSYLVKQLKAFKNGNRIDPTMNAMAQSLSEKDIQQLAAYFSSLPNKSANNQKTEAQTSPQVSVGTKAEFPKDTFFTLKKSAEVTSLPKGDIWQGGPNMLYNTITPDGKRVLATSPSDNTLYVFDSSSGKQLAVIPVGKAPKGVKVTPNGKHAYVSNQNSANISVIELSTLSVIDTIKTEEGPHNVRFTQDGAIAYATLQGGAGIAVIDTHSRKMTKVIPVPGITGPHNLDLSPDEKTAFVRDFVNHVAVLNLNSESVKKVIKVGNGHGGIDVAPNGKFIATAAIGDNFISVIDPKTLQAKQIEVGNGPHGIRASADSRWIYTTVTKDNTIAVIDTETMSVYKKIPAGEFPFWVAVKGNP